MIFIKNKIHYIPKNSPILAMRIFMKNIILLTIITVLLVSCSSLKSIAKEPEITFDNVRIASINFTSVNLVFRFKVNNQNNVSMNIEQFKYNLLIENRRFISGVSPAPISVAKKSTSYVDIPVTVQYRELFDVFTNIYRQDTADYNLATEFTIKLPAFGSKTLNFEHGGTFPVLKVPEIAFREIRVVNMSPLAATIEFVLDITNRNSFAISPDSFNFELYINESQWLNGLLKNINELAPNRSTAVRIPITINPAQVGIELFDYIFKGNNLNVLIKGNMEMRTAYPGIRSINIPFSIGKNMPVNR